MWSNSFLSLMKNNKNWKTPVTNAAKGNEIIPFPLFKKTNVNAVLSSKNMEVEVFTNEKLCLATKIEFNVELYIVRIKEKIPNIYTYLLVYNKFWGILINSFNKK